MGRTAVPPSTFATSLEIKGPLAYNPGKAVSMLKSHGWDVKPNGVSTCASVGSGLPTQCGAGIKAGAKAEFDLNYDSGDTPVSEEMQGLKSNFSSVGIDINLGTAPFDTLIAQAAAGPVVLLANDQLGEGAGSSASTRTPPATKFSGQGRARTSPTTAARRLTI